MRWAYILAIIAFFVILMIAIMAFCLACNQPRRWKNRDVVKRAGKPGMGVGRFHLFHFRFGLVRFSRNTAVPVFTGSVLYCL